MHSRIISQNQTTITINIAGSLEHLKRHSIKKKIDTSLKECLVKADDEIKLYFLANFVECDDPTKLWIGEIIESGEENYANWLKRSQSLYYLFKTESEVFCNREKTLKKLSTIKGASHPEILRKYLQKEAISIETLVIMDMILMFSKNFDKKLIDPVWESVSLRIKKYKSFLNIDKEKYTATLKDIVL